MVWGRGYTGRGAPAFWPWVQVVNGLLDRFSDEALRGALRFGAGDLAQIVPQIKELFPDLEPPAPADPETAQFRVFEAITGFLRRLSQTQPIVVIIDDLHWSDAASQQLVLLTSAAAADAKLLLVALYRDVDPYLDDGLAATLVDLTRQRELRRIELGGLDDHAVTAMLQSAGGLPTPDAVATVMRRTRGQPVLSQRDIAIAARLARADSTRRPCNESCRDPCGVRCGGASLASLLTRSRCSTRRRCSATSSSSP